MRLFLQVTCLCGFLTAFDAFGIVNVFTNRTEFVAASGATNATGPIPNTGPTAGTVTLGSVTYSRLSGATQIYVGSGGAYDYTARLPGNDIAVNRKENLLATFHQPVYAAGFDVVEPELDPKTGPAFVESTFSLLLKHGTTNLGLVYFNAPNDTAAFFGVTSDRPFDRMEIFEIVGGEDDEYFGPMYTAAASQSPVLPVSGVFVPEMASLDVVMRKVLDDSFYPAVSLAVTRNGRLVYARAFGWTDYFQSAAMAHTNPVIVGSVSKPLTDMAITKLIIEGRLAGTDTVLGLLGIPPPEGMTFAPGAEDITVWNLVDHAGGFPEYKPDNNFVGTQLGLGRAASFAELIAWQATQPLLFQPGTGSQYSNFGYEILGVIIEKVTGMSYGEHLRQIFSETLEARSIRVPPELQVTNPAPATTLLAETYANNAAAGGVQISSSDLCRIMRAYRINGNLKLQPVPGGGFFFTFFGSVPGGMSVVNQRISGGTGTEFAISCNSRGEVSNGYLKDSVIVALDALPAWPTNDFFPSLDWKMDNFWNAANGSMATNSAFVHDFDGDGLQNLFEYAFGLNAKLFNATNPPPVAVSSVAGQFEFHMPMVPARVDCALDLLVSTNLTDWTPVVTVIGDASASLLEPGFSLVDAGTGSSRTLTLLRPDATSGTAMYFRWRLRLQEPGL